jgi:hypothetical protein
LCSSGTPAADSFKTHQKEKRLKQSLLLLILTIALSACQENAPEPEADTPDSSETAEFACPFDESSQDDAFMEELDHFVNYTWIDSAKMAVVPLANQDTLFITRGGCVRFNFYGELHTSVTNPVLTDMPFWFERGLALSQSFMPEEDSELINRLIKEQSYTIDATNNQLVVTFEQSKYCEMTMLVFVNQKQEHNILLEIGRSEC